MFELGEKVRIKSNSVIGTIVDIFYLSGKPFFTVESDSKGVTEGYGGDWKLFECAEEDIIAYNIRTA